GTGMIVKDLMKPIDQLNLDYVAILGTEATRKETEKITAENHLQKCFFDYDEMLESEVDTIYVALPNFLHFQFAKDALKAGKHVILEKPGTANLDEFQELRELALNQDKILIEAMTTHYLPAFQRLKEDLTQLGNLKIVSVNYSQYSSRYDRFKAGEILPAFDPEKAGGALMDLNVYNLHFVVGLFGEPMNVRYYANIEKNIDTSGIMILDYGTFKAVCIGAKDCKAQILSSLQGDGGNITITVPVNQMKAYTQSDNRGNSIEKQFDEGKHRMYYEFQEFSRIIDEHDTEKADEMLKISMIVSKIMQEGKSVY
ncbi:MAG: Gfo/Idh/MocA family oxidoreductase, partial [Clostridiales bacterium]|nr:Gfo/Idh/MocA family oxidoreductase [Clostridiales bacterium]